MIRDVLLIMMGMIIMKIITKLYEINLNARTKTISDIVLTKEQVQRVQELLETFKKENMEEEK